MMDYYSKNMAIIKQNRPKLYQSIIQVQDNAMQNQYPELQEIFSQTAKDGEPVMMLQWDGQIVRMNSAYSPQKEAAKWCAQYCFDNLNITVLMFGIGNGIILRELKKHLYSDAEIVVYEPSMRLFDYTLHHEDISDLLGCTRITFLVEGVNEDCFFYELHRRTQWSQVVTQVRCFHPQYDELFGEAARNFLQQIKKCNELAKCNRDTRLYFTVSAMNNLFCNLPFVLQANAVDDYVGKIPTKVPAIVVAAGPSLNKNIDDLKQAEGKAFIMATDTAVRGLLEHGIHFDCMVTIDPEKPANYLSDIRCKEVPLFCSLESNAEIMQFHTGKKIWFSRDIYLKELYDKYNQSLTTCTSGGSVATTAFSIAVALGFKRIVLVGQDLAFQGNVSHADWVESEGDDVEITLVEGIDGGMVRSRPDWMIFLMWYEEIISTLPQVDVIDATEGGALIHGSRIQTLKQTILEYCDREVDCSTVFSQMLATFTGQQQIAVRNDLLHMEYELEKIQQYAEEGLEICDLIENCADACKQERLLDDNLKKISDVNDKIIHQLSYELVDRYIAWDTVDVMDSINMMTDDQRKNQLITVNKAKVVYKAYIKAVGELKPLAKEMTQEI